MTVTAPPLRGTSPATARWTGKLLFNAKLPAGVSTYRAHLLPWHPVGFGHGSRHA